MLPLEFSQQCQEGTSFQQHPTDTFPPPSMLFSFSSAKGKPLTAHPSCQKSSWISFWSNTGQRSPQWTQWDQWPLFGAVRVGSIWQDVWCVLLWEGRKRKTYSQNPPAGMAHVYSSWELLRAQSHINLSKMSAAEFQTVTEQPCLGALLPLDFLY